MGQAQEHSTISGKYDAGPFQCQTSKCGISKGGCHIIKCNPKQ